MARLVIVSNRVATPADRAARAGGLAVAMREMLRQEEGLWFGWSGGVSEGPHDKPEIVEAGNVTYATVDLTRSQHEKYYVSYANGTLWPLLHYRLGLVEYRRYALEGYLQVNAHLAKLLVPLLRPDDVIWVHDYHLIPFGMELRKLGVANRIGFFLHTPFPAAQLIETLPRHALLLQALAAYDLVGFQTDESLRAFFGCVTDLVQGKVFSDGAYSIGDRRSRAGAFPIGIDTEGFAKLARRAAESLDAHRLLDSLSGRQLMMGVDRLDYSKGIPNRFEAIDSLLTEHPEHRGQFHYLQITPHSRGEVAEYRALRRELESAVGRINGKFAEFDWTPLRYINKSFSRQTLAGFYRFSRIGLVTPLRDGMNLVAKEFVASQDPKNPGVLILSRFAGAAHELKAALQVNPYDVDDIASAMHRGFSMSDDERRTRWNHMMDVIQRNTVTSWRNAFLGALRETELVYTDLT